MSVATEVLEGASRGRREGAAVPGSPADDAGFAGWVTPHLPVLAAIAVREVGADGAEDVVQEALLRAWRRRKTFDAERGSVRAWLVAIVLDQARRSRTRKRSALQLVPDVRNQPVDDRLLVESAVRTLPRRQREVVTLFYLADLSTRDIAGLLGLTESAVRVHLHAARAKLREILEQT